MTRQDDALLQHSSPKSPSTAQVRSLSGLAKSMLASGLGCLSQNSSDRQGLAQSSFRRIFSDIVEFRHDTVASSSRLPGSGDVLTAFTRIVTGPVRRDETL